MKNKTKELIDFYEYLINCGLAKRVCPRMSVINDYLSGKSINYELSEPEADGCNKQAKELKSDSIKIEIKSKYVPDMRHYPIIIIE